jgi:hypothetical protein
MQHQIHTEQHQKWISLEYIWSPRMVEMSLTCPHPDVTTVYSANRILCYATVRGRVNVMSVATGAERREEQWPIGQKFSCLRNGTHRLAVPGQPADARRWAATRRAVHAGPCVVSKVHSRRWLLQEGWTQERCGSCGRARISSYSRPC